MPFHGSPGFVGNGPSRGRAPDAERHSRVEIEPTGRNFLAALLTIAELTCVDPMERGFYPGTAHRTAAMLRMRHGLALEGVHATEAADRLLVEYHGPTIFIRKRISCGERFEFRSEPGAPGFDLFRAGHGFVPFALSNWCSHPISCILSGKAEEARWPEPGNP